MAANVSTGYVTSILGQGLTFASLFQDGCIEIRSGEQPPSADQAATGDLLARITRDGVAWTAGSTAGGLRFQPAGRWVSKDPSHTWRVVGLAAGVASWCRLVANAYDDGAASYELPRIDGAVGALDATGDVQLYLPSTEILLSTDIAVEQWLYAIPPLE